MDHCADQIAEIAAALKTLAPFLVPAEAIHQIITGIFNVTLSGLEPDLVARASVIRTKAVTKRTQVLVLRLRHQLHQSRWTGSQYEALPDLLVEECPGQRQHQQRRSLLLSPPPPAPFTVRAAGPAPD
jgi:hypothetical protein